MTTICGKCEHEWSTDTGGQVCPACGNDGEIECHVVRHEQRRVLTRNERLQELADRGIDTTGPDDCGWAGRKHECKDDDTCPECGSACVEDELWAERIFEGDL
jgi:hypothetical protein